MRSVNYWRTRDGRALVIAEMTDDHLDNAVRFLRRQGFVTPAEYAALLVLALQAADVPPRLRALRRVRVSNGLAALEREQLTRRLL